MRKLTKLLCVLLGVLLMLSALAEEAPEASDTPLMEVHQMMIGFADGYNRRLSNKGMVRINGKTAPIIGRVCMDQFMVDVTEIPNVQRGDTVALLGDHVSILWMANLLDVNVDEIVCGISKRVPRVYEVEGE